MKCVFHWVVFWKELKIQWKIFYLIDVGGYVLQGFRWQEIKLVFHFILFWPPSRLAKTFILQSKKELVKMFTYKLIVLKQKMDCLNYLVCMNCGDERSKESFYLAQPQIIVVNRIYFAKILMQYNDS